MPEPKRRSLVQIIAFFRAKYQAWIISRRIKKVILTPPAEPSYEPTDELKFELDVLSYLEQTTTTVLDGLGVQEDYWPYYQGFAKRLWKRRLKFSQGTYGGERDVLTAEYVTRGWSEPVLEALYDVVELAAEYKMTGGFPKYPGVLTGNMDEFYAQFLGVLTPLGALTGYAGYEGLLTGNDSEGYVGFNVIPDTGNDSESYSMYGGVLVAQGTV